MAFVELLKNDSIDIIYVRTKAALDPFVQEYNELFLTVLKKESYTEIQSKETTYLKIDKIESTYTFTDHINEDRDQSREYLASREELIKNFNSYPQKIITVDLESLLGSVIPANTLFLLEKFEDAGFTYINHQNTKHARINFINKTIQFVNSFDDVEPLKTAEKLFDYYYVTPEWFRHEALHTTNVLLESVNNHLLEHHYYHQEINPLFNKHIDRAISALFDAYQAVGLDEENEVKKYMDNIFRTP